MSARASWLVLIAAAACTVPPERQAARGAFDDLRRVVATLDDITGEYRHATARGEEVSATRMRVMLRQLHDATVFAQRFPDEEQEALHSLQAMVEARADAADVVAAARALRATIMENHRLVLGPGAPPPRPRAEKQWRELCAGCHGPTGAGDGAQGLYLDPEPKDFQDPEFLATLSPARAFSWISDGVPETAMPGWGLFTPGERWALASLVFSFRYDDDEVERGRHLLALLDLPHSPRALAHRTDAELRADLEARGLTPEQAADALAYLRDQAAFSLPAGPLAPVRGHLAEAAVAYRAQRREEAAAHAAVARARIAAATDAIAVTDPVTAGRLEHGVLAIENEIARLAVADTVEHEIARTDALVDRAEAALRAPSVSGGVRLALAGGAAAALALGLLAAGVARRRAVIAIGAGLAVAGIAGALAAPGSAALGWCLLIAVALLPLARVASIRASGELQFAAAAALVALPLAARGRALIAELGTAGLVPWLAGAAVLAILAVAGWFAGAHMPRLRRWALPIAVAIAVAAAAGRGAWLIATETATPPLLRLPRIDALGVHPVTGALIAAVAAAVAAAATFALERAPRGTRAG